MSEMTKGEPQGSGPSGGPDPAPPEATGAWDWELRLLAGVTRRMPATWGLGAVKNAVRRFYQRRPRGVVSAEVLGLDLVLDLNQPNDASLLLGPQFYDRWEVAWLHEHLRPGDVFVDAGAYIGIYSLLASRLVGGEGQVVALEPFPTSFAFLRENLRRNGASNVTAVQAAVTDREQERRVHVPSHGKRTGNTLRRDDAEGPTVRCLPLHRALEEAGVERVTGLKLDVEGYEYRVLEQFFGVAPEAAWPAWAIVEYFPSRTERTGEDVLALLEARGYDVRSPPRRHRRSSANRIAVRR